MHVRNKKVYEEGSIIFSFTVMNRESIYALEWFKLTQPLDLCISYIKKYVAVIYKETWAVLKKMSHKIFPSLISKLFQCLMFFSIQKMNFAYPEANLLLHEKRNGTKKLLCLSGKWYYRKYLFFCSYYFPYYFIFSLNKIVFVHNSFKLVFSLNAHLN